MAINGGTTKRGPCPQCDRGPRDKAMAITNDERGTVAFCHRCGYVEVENQRAREFVPIRSIAAVQPLEWSTLAESIWHRTQALRGSLGETYLAYRGCAMPPRDSHLRFLPGDDRYPPSLCAAITDVVSGKPISLHFTRLANDGKGKAGSECDKRLLKGHRKGGGCIRLWPDDCVSRGLAIAEGIESALAAAHLYTPVWATVDAGNMKAFPTLAGVESLTIFADHDAAGLDAAQECAQRWIAAGSEVSILTPRQEGHDACDAVAA